MWLVQMGKRAKIGNRAGSQNKSGYREIKLFGKMYKEHRIIWYLQTGAFPAGDLDHIDGSRANNKWGNLRPATRSQNCANSRKYKSNTTGYKGVDLHRGRPRAQIQIAKKKIFIGCYDTFEEARDAYIKEAEKHFGEYARGA